LQQADGKKNKRKQKQNEKFDILQYQGKPVSPNMMLNIIPPPVSPNMMLNLPIPGADLEDETFSEHDGDQAIFDCFSPTHEPLAIHFLHDIIFIEASLNQLNNTLDFVSNN